MSQLSVSVVIPAYNCQKTISSSIKAVLNQSYPINSIIVVDDGSTDDTAKIIQTFPNVKYFYQSNAGPAKARNRGAQEAQADLIFFTDSDCLPQKDWIERAVEHFDKQKSAVVAGSYGIANPQSMLARCIHKEILFRHHNLMPVFPKAFGSYNFGIRKNIFDEVGGFDESYRNASGEDNDLSYKIIKAGYKIYFAKDSLVDHFHTTDAGKYLKEQYRHGFWRVKMYQEHPQMMKGDDYTFWKDMIEVPLVGIMGLSLVGIFLQSKEMSQLFVCAIVFMMAMELFFALRITKNILEMNYFGCVMFLRSFARTLGLSSGILQIFVKKYIKKVK